MIITQISKIDGRYIMQQRDFDERTGTSSDWQHHVFDNLAEVGVTLAEIYEGDSDAEPLQLSLEYTTNQPTTE